MEIDRYVLKNRNRGEYFGSSEVTDSENFRWHYTPGRIGLEGKLTPEADNFLHGFLDRQDQLYVISPRLNPMIIRDSDRRARLESDVEGMDNIQNLLNLLNHPETYAFLTSNYEHGHQPGILTFALTPPSERLYSPTSTLPVRLIDRNPTRERKVGFSPGELRL